MIIGVDASRASSGQRTGTENYAFHLIRALIPIALEQGHHLRLYTNLSPSESLVQGEEHVEQVSIPFPRLWTHFRLARELRRRPPDLFFTPSHVIPFTYFGASVATVHDMGFYFSPNTHTYGQAAYLRWSTRHNCNRSQRIIADSIATKHDISRVYHLNEAKIDVIYPGVDPEFGRVDDNLRVENVGKKYGVTSPYLLYLGTIHPRKNLVRLIQAFATMPTDGHHLILAGKRGWLDQPIVQEIQNQDQSVRDRIIQTGYIDDDDKAALITGADALLFPSLYEGFGFPILEGNACDTPVLCANSSSLPEVAGDAALIVDPMDVLSIRDGIQQIVRDKMLRQHLIQAGASNVARFSWQKTAEQVMITLEEAAGQHDTSR